MERILTLRGNISKRDYQQMLDLLKPYGAKIHPWAKDKPLKITFGKTNEKVFVQLLEEIKTYNVYFVSDTKYTAEPKVFRRVIAYSMFWQNSQCKDFLLTMGEDSYTTTDNLLKHFEADFRQDFGLTILNGNI